jgi:hypothetical protein
MGDKTATADGSAYPSATFDHRPTQEMFANPAELRVELQDGTGAVLDVVSMPLARLLLVEQTMRELQDRLIANLADRENRCRLVPDYADFVVVT